MKQYVFRILKVLSFTSVLTAAPVLIGANQWLSFSYTEANAGTTKTKVISNKIYKKMAPIQELMDQNREDEALEKALEVASAVDRRWAEHEAAQLYMFIGGLYQQKLNYAEAKNYYKQVLTLDVDSYKHNQVLLGYGLMQFMTEDYRGSIASLKKYDGLVTTPNALIWEALASAHYNLKEYDNTLSWLNKSIAHSQSKGKIGKEKWYQMSWAVYTERNDTPNAIKALEVLAKHYPKERYLVPLESYYDSLREENKRS